MKDLTEGLVAYREWLEVNAALLAKRLRKGLKPDDIRAAIDQYSTKYEDGFPFPEDHYPLFQVFNGQRDTKAWLLPNEQVAKGGFAIASLELMSAWRSNAQGMIYALKGLEGYGSARIDPKIRSEFWNANWFPFASGEYQLNGEGVGLLLFLDFAPVGSGSRGQVVLEEMPSINFKLHISRTVVAPSLSDYFFTLVKTLRKGDVTYDPKVGLRMADLAISKSTSTSSESAGRHVEHSCPPERGRNFELALIERWKAVTKEVSSLVDWYEVDPPVPNSEIGVAERQLGRPFPSLLRGMLEYSGSWQWRDVDYDVIFSRPEQILQDSIPPSDDLPAIEVSKSKSDRVKPYFYSSERLTFAYSDYLRFQIDNDPANDGEPGQIVVVDHDEQTIDFVAESLSAFVSHGLDQLQCVIDSGRYPDGGK